VIVLGIDTATRFASVAILDGDRVLAEARSDETGRRTDLLVLVDRACTAAKLTPRELAAVAIGAGPGSFTSLRIGMATAKGIAFAAHAPLWAISSLAALAAQAPAIGDDRVAAVLDARRGEVYVAAFDANGLVGEPRVLPPDQLDSLGATRFVGDAGAAYPQLLALPGIWDRTPLGADVARLALAGPRADVLVTGVPAYIRPAEAEILYPDGVPGARRKRP
jgi:tRNA threonylcarbamoyladenosine biosynthesis protein TsaB